MSKATYDIAVLPGDGIGPEVVDSAITVLDAAVASDAACMLMVVEPERFDVVVTGNQFGDIVSELAAGQRWVRYRTVGRRRRRSRGVPALPQQRTRHRGARHGEPGCHGAFWRAPPRLAH